MSCHCTLDRTGNHYEPSVYKLRDEVYWRLARLRGIAQTGHHALLQGLCGRSTTYNVTRFANGEIDERELINDDNTRGQYLLHALNLNSPIISGSSFSTW